MPLVAQGMSQQAIADEVGVSRSTVRRWMDNDPAFSEAIEAQQAAAAGAVEDAADRIADIVSASLEALAELVRSEDPKIRLDATKTALDRFGHPVNTKAEQSVDHRGGQPVIVLSDEDMRRAAQGKVKNG